MGGAVEQVKDRVGIEMAFRADVIGGLSDPLLEILQFRAVAGTELRQHSTSRAGERGFGRMNLGRWSAKDAVMAATGLSFLDNFSVNLDDRRFQFARPDDAID